jgi:excinuclease ABC subunit C
VRRAGLPPQRTQLVGLAKARYVPRGDDLGEQSAPLDGEDALRAFERVYLPGKLEPIVLEPASLECRFLARVRDAAHRAAIRFHRELRRKSALRSGLEEIPGVGKKRRAELLARFGSLKRIREATEEELRAVLPAHVATELRAFFAAPPEADAAADAADGA